MKPFDIPFVCASVHKGFLKQNCFVLWLHLIRIQNAAPLSVTTESKCC